MEMKLNTLELFAGSRSFTKVSKSKDNQTFCSDYIDFGEIDYVTDILQFDYDKVPFIPDIIWASPPCTGFSVAAIGYHWGGGKGAYIPKTDTALLGIALVKKTVEVIEHYKKLNPNLKWYIENPRGVLRKLNLIEGKLNTITYCQYGDTRMKPTDIWTNDLDWTPKEMCKNGMPCHVAAPRGSKTGTQGLKGAYNRSQIPAELFEEILNGK